MPVLEIEEHAAFLKRGVARDLIDPVDGAGGNPLFREKLKPIGARLRQKDILDFGNNHGAMFATVRIVGKLPPSAKLFISQRLPETGPDGVCPEREIDRSVGCVEGLIDGDDTVRAARALRHFAGAQIGRNAAGEKPGHAFDKTDIDLAALTAAGAIKQGPHSCHGCILSGQHVCCRRADFLCRAILRAGDVHDSGIPFRDQIITGEIGTLAGQPEARDGDEDQIFAHCFQAVMVQFEFLLNIGRLVRHENVCRRHKRHQLLEITFPAQIERHAFLVPIDGIEPERMPIQKGRPPLAGVIAFRTLDLDNFRTKIRKKHRRVGAGDRRRQIHDTQSRQKPEAFSQRPDWQRGARQISILRR